MNTPEAVADSPNRDALDDKVNRLLPGQVVRKDLLRKLKAGSNVPAFVLEFLLGKYCACSDEMSIQMGLQVVNDTLSKSYIRQEESSKAQSEVKRRGRHTFIDKIKVRLVDSDYWAEGVNFGHKYIHIPEEMVHRYERLLTGGVWAQIEMTFQFDEDSNGKHPFWITRLDPIQTASFDLDEYISKRREFSSDEWMDLLLRSMGYETEGMERRLKLLYLMRLVPMVERNFNLVELGPRQTGKSYVAQQISPYAALLTGSPSVPQLFGHATGRQKGQVQLWDAVAFDEVAQLKDMPKEMVPMLQTYCESGQYQRGTEAATGEASICLFGNTSRPVEVMVQTSHLFEPLPENLRAWAFLDRLHFYLPGWEIPVANPRLYTSHFGMVVDYLAEALRGLRKLNFTEIATRGFSFGPAMTNRDIKAVQKTCSGLMKILYPHGNASVDELRELVELAMEGRRRVKEQLKKLGSFEFHNTSFSYRITDTGEEHFVGVPEQGGRNLILPDPPGPGVVYTAGVDDATTVGLYRLEVTKVPGTGKLKTVGGVSGAMKESISRAFAYLNSKKGEMGLAQEMALWDLNLEVIDLIGNRVEAEVGMAFFLACCSAIRGISTPAAMLVLGDMSVQGNPKALRSVAEPLRVALDNGAKRVLLPSENRRSMLDVSNEVVEGLDAVFYSDPRQAAGKVFAGN